MSLRSDAGHAAQEAAPPSPPPAPAATAPANDDGARSYTLKCAGCHTVGKGKLTGPDLRDATAWTRDDLARGVKLMEKNVGPLPPEEVEAIVDLLKSPDLVERLKAEEERVAKALAATFDPPSPQAGERLFDGRTPFANGGLACASCHAANGKGGGLGPDLLGVHTKLGEGPLVSACEKTNYKIMSAAYRAHPVTKQEAIHLAAFFGAIEQRPVSTASVPLVALGSAAAAVSFAALVIMVRNRAAGTRRKLARRRRDVVD